MTIEYLKVGNTNNIMKIKSNIPDSGYSPKVQIASNSFCVPRNNYNGTAAWNNVAEFTKNRAIPVSNAIGYKPKN